MINSRIRIYISAVIVLITNCVAGQTLKGRITDKNSKALAYANIGVKGKAIGGIANSNGQFSIDISKAGPEDQIIISYIGYKPATFAIKGLKSEIFHEIMLQKAAYQLNTITISNKKKPLVLGNNKHSAKFTGWGRNNQGIGKARGMIITPEEFPVKLNRFFMYINDNTFDSIRFRLNLLVFEEGKKPLPITNKNIFFTATGNRKWVSVNIEEYNIVVSTKIVLAVEWVDAWTKNASRQGSNLLTFSMSNKKGYFYTRETPEEPIELIKSRSTPAMYFECYRVD